MWVTKWQAPTRSSSCSGGVSSQWMGLRLCTIVHVYTTIMLPLAYLHCNWHVRIHVKYKNNAHAIASASFEFYTCTYRYAYAYTYTY